MLAYIIRRVLQALLVMAVMSALVFAGLYVVGDPVAMMASAEATELERDAIRSSFGLDKPLLQQYGIFMSHALRLDFGKSFLTGQSAMQPLERAGCKRRRQNLFARTRLRACAHSERGSTLAPCSAWQADEQKP